MTTSEMTRVQSMQADTVSHQVISAIAEATGTDPMQLEPLYHVVDPDALDRLFQPSASGRVTFELADCRVTVDANGEVDVVPTGEDPGFSVE